MKRRKAASSKSPLIRLVGLEAAVAATGIAGCLTALAAPGDLDPNFGDVGRQSDIALPSYYSSLWSVDVQADDTVLFGGGGEYEYYTTYEDNFLGRLLPNGAPDGSFAAAVDGLRRGLDWSCNRVRGRLTVATRAVKCKPMQRMVSMPNLAPVRRPFATTARRCRTPARNPANGPTGTQLDL